MKKIIFPCLLLLIFSACEKDLLTSVPPVSKTNIVQKLNDFIPDDVKIITLTEWKEASYKKEMGDKFIVATESKEDFADFDSLKGALGEMPLAYIGSALDDEISRFTGASTVEESLYITHTNPQKGIVTSIFPIKNDSSEEGSKNVFTKEVRPTEKEKKIFRDKILYYAKNELSFSNNELDSLKSEFDDFANHDHSDKLAEGKNDPNFNKEDLSYIQTEIGKIYNEVTTHNKTRRGINKENNTSLENYALRTVIRYKNLADYKYKHIFRMARGTRQQGGEERFYVETIHESGIGVQYLASLFPYTSKQYRLGCMLHQYLDNVLHKIELESYAEEDFFIESYSPSNGSGDGNATYSGSQNFGIKLKPLKPSEILEFNFNMGHSYSYTLPDVRFYVNHTPNNAKNDYYDNFRFDDGAQKLNFTFNLERAVGGEFGDYAEGLHRRGFIIRDIFVDKKQWPLFLKSAMKIDANVIYSAPTSNFSTYGSRIKWFYISANLHKHKWVCANAWKPFCWFASLPEGHSSMNGDSSYFNGIKLNLNSLL